MRSCLSSEKKHRFIYTHCHRMNQRCSILFWKSIKSLVISATWFALVTFTFSNGCWIHKHRCKTLMIYDGDNFNSKFVWIGRQYGLVFVTAKWLRCLWLIYILNVIIKCGQWLSHRDARKHVFLMRPTISLGRPNEIYFRSIWGYLCMYMRVPSWNVRH